MNDKVNKKFLKLSGILAIVMAVAIIIIGILELIVIGYKSKLEFLEAGEKWSSNGDRFAVISLYSETESAFSTDQALSWAHSIDTALLNSSVTPKEGARSWTYCYAAEETISVTGSKGDTSAETTIVGGDFFIFHPMKFVYGSHFLNDDSNPMGIVIDRNLAWKIFGAENIVGMNVEINGKEFTVSGVCDQESDSGIYGYTYGERPRMYMSCSGYASAFENAANLTVFETALPNSVKGFGKNIFNSAVKINEETNEVFEVTDRFSLLNRYNNMKILKYSWIRNNKIEYPYWENEAKVYDYYCAIIMIFEIVFAAIFVTALVTSIVLLHFSNYSLLFDMKKIAEKMLRKVKK